MCGIVAAVGRLSCKATILSGLQALEYRGYDSAGIACLDSFKGDLVVVKAVGPLANLRQQLVQTPADGMIGIGHTRWATHGAATYENAHPQLNCHADLAVVHNGIIEHCDALRLRLKERGHQFVSQTDTELVAHLLSDLIKEHSTLPAAMLALAGQLQGAFALVIMLRHHPDTLLIARRRSPLVIGLSAERTVVASDQLAFDESVTKVLFVPDECVGVVHADSYELYHEEGKRLLVVPQQRQGTLKPVDKGGFADFMLKEMYEQKRAISATIDALRATASFDYPLPWQAVRKVYLVAAGTSWHAGRIAQFFFELVAGLPTRVFLASEFRYMPFFPETDALYIFISQSGETADTLEALRLVSRHQLPTLALTNVATSSIVREASAYLLMHAGPEIAVASTKAFSCQVASLYWFAHYIAVAQGRCTVATLRIAEEAVYHAARVLEEGLEQYRDQFTNELAPRYAAYDRMIFLGRHVSYPFALEASLKLKEISYIFAQCYPAGELKHGPIALIDAKTPVVLFSVLDPLIYEKLVANAQEVKARGGHLVVFAFQGQQELINLADTSFVFAPVAPLLAPLAMTGMMQFFAYAITRHLGRPVDKPRNLAKSVTVE